MACELVQCLRAMVVWQFHESVAVPQFLGRVAVPQCHGSAMKEWQCHKSAMGLWQSHRSMGCHGSATVPWERGSATKPWKYDSALRLRVLWVSGRAMGCCCSTVPWECLGSVAVWEGNTGISEIGIPEYRPFWGDINTDIKICNIVVFDISWNTLKHTP